WTAAGGLVGIGVLPFYDSAMARGVSDDGSVVVGTANVAGGSQAIVWRGGTLTGLGFPGGVRSAAAGVSGSGGAVAASGDTGDGFTHAFQWTQALGYVDLGMLPGGMYAEATAISRDGSAGVGNGGAGLG